MDVAVPFPGDLSVARFCVERQAMKKRYFPISSTGVLIFVTMLLSCCAGTPRPNSGSQAAAESQSETTILARSHVSPTRNPLVARYSIELKDGEAAEVEFGPTTTYGLNTWKQPAPAGGGIVNLLVAGMRPATVYHMRALVGRADGTIYKEQDRAFTTGTVPAAWMPAVSVKRTDGEKPSSGIELLDLNGQSPKLGAVAYDLRGNLIWYYDFGANEAKDVPFPMKLLPNGNILMVVAGPDNGYREIDLAGNVIRGDTEADIQVKLREAGFSLVEGGLEHDILRLPNGHTILIAYENRIFNDLPGYPGETNVSGDALIDIDEHGRPTWTWSVFDHLDINRHPFGLPDWTHANAVIYSPDDGDLILSLRNQSWVMKIDYEDGQGSGRILWRLGAGGDFTLTNGGVQDWNYGQHYPTLISPNSMGQFELAMFDNGDNRPMGASGIPCSATANPMCFSRPVVFQLDEQARTATINWQNKLPVYSYCCGSVDLLPSGNMEFDIAATVGPPQFSTVQEIAYPGEPRLVWQMIVEGQLAYRATRLPSLYPGVQW